MYELTFILKKVTLVNRSTDDFKSTNFSVLDDGKFVCKLITGVSSETCVIFTITNFKKICLI